MRTRTMDLTEGNITSLLCRFAIPILLGQVFQNLYNSVDAVVVGHFCGTTALAAVSACSDMSRLLTGFFTGLSNGTGILLARAFGAKDYKKLHDAIHTALLFSLLLGVFMAAAGILCSGLLLRLTDCPEDVFAQALQYLRVYLFGIFLTAMYNVGAGVLRAVGDSRTPLYYLIIASAVNTLTDLIAVIWLDMGVLGAAAATVISQMVSAVLVFQRLMRTREVYQVRLADAKIDRALLLDIINLGIPNAVQNSLNAVSSLFIQRYINGFQAFAIAGVGAAKKVDKFAGLVALSIGNATSMFVSQNIGAGQERRAVRSVHISLLMTLAFSACVSVPAYLCAPYLIKIFNNDPEVLFYGVGMIRVIMPLYCLQGISHIYTSAIRGFGHSRVIMLLNIFSLIIVKQIFLAVSMGISRDIRFVYWCYPLSWAVASILNVAYYRLFIRSKLHLADNSPSS